jgi:hypothetical protein
MKPPVCPQECLVNISKTTDLSFVLKRIGPLTAIIISAFYLLAFYLIEISNTPETSFASVYRESFIETAHQHHLLLVGIDTLIYRKYYDIPPILVGHQDYFLALLRGSEALLESGIGKGNFAVSVVFLIVDLIQRWSLLLLTPCLGLLLPMQ